MGKSYTAAVIITFCVIGGAAFTVTFFKEAPKQTAYYQRPKDMQIAMDALLTGQGDKAQKILVQKKQEIEKGTYESSIWLDLFIRTCLQNKDIAQLLYLFEYAPSSFYPHEEASLLVANTLISTNKPKEYLEVRKLFRGREKEQERWFFLDIDQLLLSQQKEKALEMLYSASFKEKNAEKERLLRLSLLEINDTPLNALENLANAQKLFPQDPEIRSVQGHLYNRLNKDNEAEKNFILASKLAPLNPHYKTQLLRFYLHKKEFNKAQDLVENNLSPPTHEQIWKYALFLDKVIKTANFSLKGLEPDSLNSSKIIQQMQALSPDQFWNDKEETSDQIVFWLTLLQNLQEGKKQEALTLLEENFYQPQSLYPELELSLRKILNYQLNGSLNLDNTLILLQPKPEYTIGLFKEVQLASKQQTPPSYMADNQVIAALFLQAGFQEAALKLLDGTFLQNIFPEEITVAYTEALVKNRSPSDALHFLATQENLSLALQLKKAEALVEEGNYTLATPIFYEVALSQTPSGEKATITLAKQLMEEKQFKKAQKLLNSNALASGSFKGKELLARAAVFQNNPSQALILYQSIQEDSTEAQSYLARAAFEQEDFEKAKELTIKLLESYPDNQVLKNNLDSINKMSFF